ncbi:thermonuclease family protein [Dongia sp.]|uniref:thermonuclease family protein n=1 Tax=Dongia sp. TaxID=1977262 RepID=UPI0034A55F3D
MIRYTIALLLIVLPASASAETLTGIASVIDGDTIEIHGQRIRLHGIDAPESSQTCNDATATPYRCGQKAALALAEQIDGQPVACDVRDVDRYGRLVAVCFAESQDINAWLVASGLAVEYRKYSLDYVGQEATAQAARIGLWSGSFVMPWDFRHGQSASTPANDNLPADAQCSIKGNISNSGKRIYHVQGSGDYDLTRIDESKGERWFCTEAEAIAAGWLRARGS